MTSSYDDSTNSAHGRARVPGTNGSSGYEGGYDSYDAYSPAPAARASGSGRATVGRASVRPASGFDEYDSGDIAPRRSGASGRASVGRAGTSGRATVGRASVGGPDDLTGFSGDPGGRPAGASGPPPVLDKAARAKRIRKARRRNLILSAV